MDEKLIITRSDHRIITSVFEENEMVQVSAEKEEAESILGNIYLGKVKNIIKNINAAFIEIENGEMCYLSLTEENHPVFANPKRNNKINIGDTIVVQVAREKLKTKVANAVTNFSITGKYAVLTHGIEKIGVSSKIADSAKREKLKSCLANFKKEGYGLIARTNSQNASKEQLEEELKLLEALYDNIVTFGIHKSCFSCIYHAPKTYLCNIRDSISESLKEIIVEDMDIYQEIEQYLNCYQKEDLGKLRYFEDNNISLSALYGIETKLQKALQKQVWLKSGGTLVIEPTEALTVIDVNTGKAIQGKRNVQETFRKLNHEAAKEIAHQIRLRNLSGIIIIDFIDLKDKEAQEELLSYMEELLKHDPVKTVLVDMTPLGLVEITRKKVRKPLHEQMKNSII